MNLRIACLCRTFINGHGLTLNAAFDPMLTLWRDETAVHQAKLGIPP